MRLHHLLQDIPEISYGGLPDFEITALTADSRQVRPGMLFVAVRGENVDGHRFLSEAAARGALVAVGEEPDLTLSIPYLRVSDSRRALAHLAAAWHNHPARQMVMIGVTGTDGKTTTVNLVYQILRASGLQTGMITTVNAIIGETMLATGLHVTTPDALEVQGYLAQMVDVGMTHCVLEATSHGLAQQRVAACDFDIAVVTNITHEHLDYHGTYEDYQRAKGSLFSGLSQSESKAHGPVKTAVLNRDDSSFSYLRQIADAKQVTYGLTDEADVVAQEVISDADGLCFTVRGSDYAVPLSSPLIGIYNVANCLAAFSTAVEGLHLPASAAVEGIAALRSVPGRMERLDLGQPFHAIVDFAHTPNALRRALETSRQLTHGNVIAVFGSAGLRDREKRRLMAEVSAELADVTILTAEDPRTESLDDILEEMAVGARAQGGVEGVTFYRIPDRGQALRFAVRQAKPGDLVISCGKGHEQSMCFGEVEHAWDDRVALRAALAEMLGIDGPDMPRLPTSI
jgi:UDP-N-acetylmuramoyl-L-alanyl-D-glutamate--2,6-diaminopimelate ligase